MSIKRIAMLGAVITMLAAAGCKDNSSEMVCDKTTGRCEFKDSGRKQIVEVDKPLYKSIPQVSMTDEPVNQEFTPIHESQIANQDFMTMAGAEGAYNDVDLDVEIPGMGHTEAAIANDRDYAQQRFRDNLWPGGVEQQAELDLGDF